MTPTTPDLPGAPYQTPKMRDELVGQKAYLPVKASKKEQSADKILWVPVRIQDIRGGFGRVYCLIQPLGGSGRWWTWLEKLRFQLPE